MLLAGIEIAISKAVGHWLMVTRSRRLSTDLSRDTMVEVEALVGIACSQAQHALGGGSWIDC